MRLSSASVSTTRSTAGAAYVNARNSLTQTQLSSDKSIESAQVGLQTAEINLTNTLAQNEALRLQAGEALNAAKLSSGLSVSAAQTTLDNAIQSAYPTAKDGVAECDKIIGVCQQSCQDGCGTGVANLTQNQFDFVRLDLPIGRGFESQNSFNSQPLHVAVGHNR